MVGRQGLETRPENKLVDVVQARERPVGGNSSQRDLWGTQIGEPLAKEQNKDTPRMESPKQLDSALE